MHAEMKQIARSITEGFFLLQTHWYVYVLALTLSFLSYTLQEIQHALFPQLIIPLASIITPVSILLTFASPLLFMFPIPTTKSRIQQLLDHSTILAKRLLFIMVVFTLIDYLNATHQQEQIIPNHFHQNVFQIILSAIGSSIFALLTVYYSVAELSFLSSLIRSVKFYIRHWAFFLLLLFVYALKASLTLPISSMITVLLFATLLLVSFLLMAIILRYYQQTLLLHPEENPVAKPKNVSQKTSSPYASFWERLGAWSVDVVLLVLVFILLTYLSMASLTIAQTILPGMHGVFTSLLYSVYSHVYIKFFLFSGVYFIICWSSGKTGSIGERLVGIKLETISGRPLPVANSLVRVIMLFLQFLFFPGIFWMFFTQKHQMLHDILSRSVMMRRSIHKKRWYRYTLVIPFIIIFLYMLWSYLAALVMSINPTTNRQSFHPMSPPTISLHASRYKK